MIPDRNRVDVWLTEYDGLDDENLLQSYRAILNDAERRQEKRFFFEEDRRRFLVTRVLTRTVLSKYVQVSPSEWQFGENAYGCPFVRNQLPAASSLSFNISHTRHLIALAITTDRRIGIDVENVISRRAPIEIAPNFFSQTEVDDLFQGTEIDRPFRFFEYWTFKEAYIKARKMGLSLPLDKFSFKISHKNNAELLVDPEISDETPHWHVIQYRPRDEYVLALCVEGGDYEFPEIILRRIVPLGEVNNWEMVPTRSSE